METDVSSEVQTSSWVDPNDTASPVLGIFPGRKSEFEIKQSIPLLSGRSCKPHH